MSLTFFVSGAFAVLASRYTDMTAVQVREVLLTTANHKNSDGTNMTLQVVKRSLKAQKRSRHFS